MSPLQIEILMHYWAKTTDYERHHQMFDAQKDAIELFSSSMALLCESPLDSPCKRKYQLTGRGVAYVAALTEMPLPVKIPAKWEIPTSVKGDTQDGSE